MRFFFAIFLMLSLIVAIVCLAMGGFTEEKIRRLTLQIADAPRFPPAFHLPDPAVVNRLPLNTGFIQPMRAPTGVLVYNAQKFGENLHLGDDLNGIGGTNSDLGDPVSAIGHGLVTFAGDGGPGWGNIVIVLHALPGADSPGERRFVQSFYGHLDDVHVALGDIVTRGDQVGTVGTADGRYLAHLHLEIREFPQPYTGPGYRPLPAPGWTDPAVFLQENALPTEQAFLERRTKSE